MKVASLAMLFIFTSTAFGQQGTVEQRLSRLEKQVDILQAQMQGENTQADSWVIGEPGITSVGSTSIVSPSLIVGPVTINMTDGSVTYSDKMTTDAAARAFWAAVASQYGSMFQIKDKP